MERPGECRCICHKHTQELMKAGPAKPSGKGGVRRNLKKNIAAKVEAVRALLPDTPVVDVEPEDSLELKNSCPKCKAVFKPTDKFCRKDGTPLCLGKPCERCSAPCEEPDMHCWACGWKLGETVPPPPQPSPLPRPGLSLTPTVDLPPGAAEIMNGQPGSVEVLAAESSPPPAEDPFARLRRQAQEQGLLPKETLVASR
jgi:hypothetical protein